MTSTPSVLNIAILVAGGFDENHITAVSRALTKASLAYKIIAPEQGLVNGWQDKGWGHYFTVDEVISTAMGSDYDVLILAGGERGVTKLKSNLHTRRIVNHFLEAGKPVAAIGAGVSLLALSPKSAGLSIAAPEAIVEELKAAQMVLDEGEQTQDGVVLTARGDAVESWVETLMESLTRLAAQEGEAQAA